jgi:hypothetical protein
MRRSVHHGSSGAKAHFFLRVNVAAEAATHKTIYENAFDSAQLWYVGQGFSTGKMLLN